MVYLDHQLLDYARRLANGANVHRITEMIVAYEQAVDLHNRQCPDHEVYRIQSEARLRVYVHRLEKEEVQRKTFIAVELAKKAALKSATLAKHYDGLEKDLQEWTDAEIKIKRSA